MSFFYLTPVKGELSAHLLEIIILKRIEYLTMLVKREPVNYNEFVVEGSIYDNVGHFMLCIAVVLCDNRDFTNLIVKAENDLFRQRLLALSSYELRSFAKKLVKSIKKHNIENDKECLYQICQYLMVKHISQHVCSECHDKYCSVYNISLNFKHCLTFVANREVEMKHGLAAVPCGRWIQLLISQFKDSLLRKVTKVNLNTLKHDPRITEIVGKVKTLYCSNVTNVSSNNILAKDVDSLSRLFPPCMLNLHNNLRENHRLSHEHRFIYSLFLKDIGMPVNEAVEFWRKEYCQIASGSICCHHWERDEKKYLYGIRHMYGLEGARKNYTSVSCQRIQCNINTKEGGCPFKSFDPTNMTKLLDKKIMKSQTFLSKVNELQVNKQYSGACIFHLQQTISQKPDVCDIPSYNFTPVKYYKIASKTNKL